MTIAYDLDGDPVDTFTREGARRIAAQIVDFWTHRGGTIVVRIETEPDPRRTEKRRLIHSVRSNLINGLPR